MRHMVATERHDEDALQTDLVSNSFVKRDQHIVHDQPAVFGVVDDMGQLFRMQSQVQRV